MGKIIEFPVAQAKARRLATSPARHDWSALDTAAAALGASLAMAQACASVWYGFGRGIGHALDAPQQDRAARSSARR